MTVANTWIIGGLITWMYVYPILEPYFASAMRI